MKSAVALACVLLISSSWAAPFNGKVSLKLQNALKTKSRVNIFVSLESTESTLAAVSVRPDATHGERATAVYNALNALATKSQAPVLEMLASPKFFALQVKSFWITNQILVSGADESVVSALAAMDEVVSIDEEIIVQMDEPIPADQTVRAEWGIQKINAEAAWAASSDGAGAVVGIIDTGARFTHEAIRDSFRAGTHSWYDPYRFSQDPRDGQGHGTHVTGTIAGANGIGVAPGAQWISCKGLNDQGSGTQGALISCGQFMACPTGYLGGNPDCSLAPHVVSNSWGGAVGGQTFFDGVIASWHDAGIIPVFAAGNAGPKCSTLGSPSDSRSRALAVAATDLNDAIASFSSRGPSTHAAAHKPDVSAPGANIRSAGIDSDSAYESFSGTSMATPHVAGLVALLKAKKPEATYDQIETILHTTSEQNLSTVGERCGDRVDSEFPNFTFGYGRIDALKAVQATM